jgi:hypothetical protein
MESETDQGGERSADSMRLAAMLDKLVAIQLDLESIYKLSPSGALVTQTNAVAQAYSALRSAIIDLREIIQRIEPPPR